MSNIKVATSFRTIILIKDRDSRLVHPTDNHSSITHKQLSYLPSNTFNVNMKNNKKDYCSVVLVDEIVVVKAKAKRPEEPGEGELKDEACKVN